MSFDDMMHEHSHDQAHDHDHSGLGHNHGAHAPYQVLLFAIVMTFLFAIIEAIGGWWANSLALLSDAGHMASDALALTIAAFASWVATKPPSTKHSYGLQRAEVVAAWLSSLMMVLISVWVIVEAIERIRHPAPVAGLTVILIAFVGLLVNILIAWMLSQGERTLNIRAALLHVMSDILGSIAALIAGAVIYFRHWTPIDPILSVLISGLILYSALKLLREALLILMEGVPGHIDLNTVSHDIADTHGVKGVHDLHIWTLSSGTVAMSAHVDINELSTWASILPRLETLLRQKHRIDHITLQPEPAVYDCKPCTEPRTTLKDRK